MSRVFRAFRARYDGLKFMLAPVWESGRRASIDMDMSSLMTALPSRALQHSRVRCVMFWLSD